LAISAPELKAMLPCEGALALSATVAHAPGPAGAQPVGVTGAAPACSCAMRMVGVEHAASAKSVVVRQ